VGNFLAGTNKTYFRQTFSTSPKKWQLLPLSTRPLTETSRLQPTCCALRLDHFKRKFCTLSKGYQSSKKPHLPWSHRRESYATMAGGINTASAPARDVVVISDELEKPLLDKRSYRLVQLPNKLEVMLIHDPETDKASAAIDVNVGSFSDPEDMPGLAHAVEHMLFMGTKKV
jgi:hypothetical protein